MRRCIGVSLIVACVMVGGCASSGPKLTQAQITALETREIDASLSETFNAASSALFDAGYTISMSDREGGILTGTKSKDRSSERFWVSPYIRDTEFVVSIQMRESSSRRTTARVKTSVNGEPRVDKAAIDQLWVLMQRQVLMHEPPQMDASAQPTIQRR